MQHHELDKAQCTNSENWLKPYRVENGRHFRLRDFDPADKGKLKSKEHAAAELQRGIDQLCDLQDKLYAQHQWAVLLIFQAMDAAGKDGTIKHVMSGVNPRLRGLFLQGSLRNRDESRLFVADHSALTGVRPDWDF